MFITRLEQLIKESNITEYKLTQDLQIPKSAIWNWKQGHQPQIDKLILLANYFEVTTDYLLGRSDDLGLINVNADLLPEEAELLALYKKMNYQNKNQLLGFAKALVF